MFRQVITPMCFIGIMIGSVSDSNAQDEYPGRFFTTPEQRKAINSIRYAVEPEITPIPLPAPEKTGSNRKTSKNIGTVKFKGYVRNHNGETVYWVNSNNSMESSFNQDEFALQHIKPGLAILRLFIEDEIAIELKVGESYMPAADDGNSSLLDEGAQQRSFGP